MNRHEFWVFRNTEMLCKPYLYYQMHCFCENKINSWIYFTISPLCTCNIRFTWILHPRFIFIAFVCVYAHVWAMSNSRQCKRTLRIGYDNMDVIVFETKDCRRNTVFWNCSLFFLFLLTSNSSLYMVTLPISLIQIRREEDFLMKMK